MIISACFWLLTSCAVRYGNGACVRAVVSDKQLPRHGQTSMAGSSSASFTSRAGSSLTTGRCGSVTKRPSAEQAMEVSMVAGVLLPGATSAAAAGAKETAPMGLRLLFVDDEPVSVWPYIQCPPPSP